MTSKLDTYGFSVRDAEHVLVMLQRALGLVFHQVDNHVWSNLDASKEYLVVKFQEDEPDKLVAPHDYPVVLQVIRSYRGHEIEQMLYDHLREEVFLLSRGALQVGLRGTAQDKVRDAQTALAMGSGSLEVFATPALVALVERAAVDALQSHLSEGKTSVGTMMEIKHIAATPLSVAVRAEAVISGLRKRQVSFRVQAWDTFEIIGEGTHERAIIDRARFMVRVAGKPRT